MQLDLVDAVDAIILAPRSAARSEPPQTRRCSTRNARALAELMVARLRQALDHGPAAGLLPHPFEDERRTDAPGRNDRRFAAVESIEHDRLPRRTAPPSAAGAPAARSLANRRSARASQSPAGGPPSPRAGSRRFADRRGRPRSSCGNTWRGARSQLDRGSHRPASAQEKSREKCRKRGTTFARPPPLAHNHIKSLRAAPMRQLSKISYTLRMCVEGPQRWSFY